MLEVVETAQLEYGQILIVLDDDLGAALSLLESHDPTGAPIIAYPDGLVLMEQRFVDNDMIDVAIEVWTEQPPNLPVERAELVEWRPRNAAGALTLSGLSGVPGMTIMRLPDWEAIRTACSARAWEGVVDGQEPPPELSSAPEGSPQVWAAYVSVEDSEPRNRWLVRLWPLA